MTSVSASFENFASRSLPFSFAKRHGVLLREQGLQVRRGASLTAVQEAQRFAGRVLPLHWLEPEAFEQQLSLAYQRDSSEVRQMAEGLGAEMDLASLAELTPESGDLLEQEDDAPIIRLINAILSEAIKAGASDIHLETFEKRLVVRFRVDGILREVIEPRRELAALLVSRVKVMARLDIAEKRVPQDGRISLKVGGREVDIRVSTLPSANGERVVLRLLDKQAGRLSLTHLGMSERDRRLLDDNLRKPHGIILVTGPTGSGKTTTLYAGLVTLNDRSRNILTVEDPIEYYLEGIGQTQVNPRVDMTFARGLRAILRQDPDVIMVGEIRDQETAQVAVRSAMTGHFVLSTLHTNSAVGSVTRLIDMGVERYLLAPMVVGLCAQRLVRRLCPNCRREDVASEADSLLLGGALAAGAPVWRAVGCDQCHDEGYRGRAGLYEVVAVDDAFQKLIHDGASEADIERHARADNPSLLDDGVAKLQAGVTTVEEVARVVRDEA